MRRAEPPSTSPHPVEPSAQPHVPRPTAWPMIMALGIAMVLGGFAISIVFSLGGAVVFAVALVGWIGELQRE